MTSKVQAVLKSVGARLKRANKHRVYELPNGRNVVLASTPSDFRAENNAIREIHHAAGIEKPEKAPRKPRAEKPGRREAEWSLPAKTPLAAALRETGLVEKQLRTEIALLEAEKASLVHVHAQLVTDFTALAETHRALSRSRWVRLGVWLGVCEDK